MTLARPGARSRPAAGRRSVPLVDRSRWDLTAASSRCPASPCRRSGLVQLPTLHSCGRSYARPADPRSGIAGRGHARRLSRSLSALRAVRPTRVPSQQLMVRSIGHPARTSRRVAMRRATDRRLGCARSLPLNSAPRMRDSERRGKCAKRSVETRDELTGQVAGLASHGISNPEIGGSAVPARPYCRHPPRCGTCERSKERVRRRMGSGLRARQCHSLRHDLRAAVP